MDDLSYEKENITLEQPHVIKLYSYILNKEIGAKAQFDDCWANDVQNCEVNGTTYMKFTIPANSFTYTNGNFAGKTVDTEEKDLYISTIGQLTTSPGYTILADELASLGEEIGVQIKAQKEEIFQMMHRI